MIAQCKGKDLTKVPKSKLLQDGWYPSVKYDGNYVQIEKRGSIVKFWTSGAKQFYIEHIADYLIEYNRGVDFTIECEYIANTEGKLGDRGKCTTTTFRTNFEKGLGNKIVLGDVNFKVWDCIYYEESIGQRMTTFSAPYKLRRNFLNLLDLGDYITKVSQTDKAYSLNNINVSTFTDEGWEGLFLIHENHIYRPGKRVNDAIKLKHRPTADLLCIDVEYSKINPEDIGSVVLQDSQGRVCAAGGLAHNLKKKEPSYFVGKVIEIEYEQILDTYIQPAFKCIREDKPKGE